MQVKGLRDDTTCIVVDLIPLDKLTPSAPPQKKQGMAVFKNMFRRKSNEPSSQSDKDCIEPDMVEELFEDGSASLEQRLNLSLKFGTRTDKRDLFCVLWVLVYYS